jgi:hypothetical protein
MAYLAIIKPLLSHYLALLWLTLAYFGLLWLTLAYFGLP